jgi:UDP-4-amino-4,6-dideoxy-N-acetyl-beta-L-altrosamine transaminase
VTASSAPAPFLPYGRQLIDDDDIAAVTAVLRGDWLTQGPAVEAFERALAERTGAAEAVSCSSGAAALHLAYLALDLQPGDAVIVPSLTFLATASMAAHAGASVVFADVDPDAGLMTVVTAEEAAARARAAGLRVRALAPVHFAGQTADLPGLAESAARLGAALVEDACHALGSQDVRDGRIEPTGGCAHSAMAVFSFHPVKTVATAEGGAVAVNDPAQAARLRRLRNQGMTRNPAEFTDRQAGFADGAAAPWYYEMPELGFNYRLSDMQAALGISQLRKLDQFIDRRRRLIARYAERLAPYAPVVRPLATVPWCRPAWHLCALRIDFAALGRRRADVMAALRAAGIGSQVHYIPVHRQPYWRRRFPDLSLPGADLFYERALSAPLHPAMADDDVDRVAAALATALGLPAP